MSEINESNNRSWFSRHKVLTAIATVVLLIIIASALGGDKSNTQTAPNSNSHKESTQAADPPAPQKEKMTIKNSTYSESNGLGQVVGEVTNNDTKVHTATLIATFYDEAGKIVGTARGAINEVAPGETKTFTLMTMDAVTGYKEMKVQVDTLL